MPVAADAAVAATWVPATAPLWRWWWQGLRTAFFRRPDWRGLHAAPGTVIVLLLAVTIVSLLTERLYIEGPATFYGQGLLAGWFDTLALAWICWWLPLRQEDGRAAPGRTDLFSLLMAQALPVWLLASLLLVPAMRLGLYERVGNWGVWLLWGAAAGWAVAAQVCLMWRTGSGARRWGAGLLLFAVTVLQVWGDPPRRWYADEPAASAMRPEPLQLTQSMLERQLGLLDTQLKAVMPGKAGQVELYSITFAPYSPEDVFLRESEMVDRVMQSRFAAGGHNLQLINNRASVGERPWATPMNLQRAIQAMAARMNRDEDVLFLHLTSHGARDGKLSASMWPLAVDEVTPQQLKAWLDEAGVRYRVISVSACYSGSWIAPLGDDGSLIMTAADESHTSFGCGSRSELTFFGRAMYAEQLQEQTHSFEVAHAAARRVIEQREQEAGKTDGYSNPQIRMGDAARKQLELLTRQLEASR